MTRKDFKRLSRGIAAAALLSGALQAGGALAQENTAHLMANPNVGNNTEKETGVVATTRKPPRVLSEETITEIMKNHRGGFKYGSASYIEILKKEKKLKLFVEKEKGAPYEEFGTYDIQHLNPIFGTKQFQGDLTTPEGWYPVTANNVTTGTQFKVAIDFGYPNAVDKSSGRSGSLVRIHAWADGSAGCPVMKEKDIEIIFAIVKGSVSHGQRADIYSFPYKMDSFFARVPAPNAKTAKFWKEELEPMHAQLQKYHRPLNVSMEGKRYALHGYDTNTTLAYTAPAADIKVQPAPKTERKTQEAKATIKVPPLQAAIPLAVPAVLKTEAPEASLAPAIFAARWPAPQKEAGSDISSRFIVAATTTTIAKTSERKTSIKRAKPSDLSTVIQVNLPSAFAAAQSAIPNGMLTSTPSAPLNVLKDNFKPGKS